MTHSVTLRSAWRWRYLGRKEEAIREGERGVELVAR